MTIEKSDRAAPSGLVAFAHYRHHSPHLGSAWDWGTPYGFPVCSVAFKNETPVFVTATREHAASRMPGRSSPVADYGRFIFRYRNIAFPIAAAAILLGFKPGTPIGALAEGATDLLGLLLAAFGQLVHVLVLGTVPIRRGGIDKRFHVDRLATEGCYAHCRNPLYFGNLLVIAGLLVVFANLEAGVIAGVFFGFSYVAIVAAEEHFLIQSFGDEYRAYCRRVPRWAPKLSGLGGTVKSLPIEWRRAVSKVYASAYSCIVVAIALLSYKSYCFRGSALTLETMVFVAVFVLCSALCLLARHLRKNGLLARRPLHSAADDGEA